MSSNEMKNAIQFFITNKNCIDFHKASGNLSILKSSKILSNISLDLHDYWLVNKK